MLLFYQEVKLTNLCSLLLNTTNLHSLSTVTHMAKTRYVYFIPCELIAFWVTLNVLAGIPELRQAICDFHQHYDRLDHLSPDQVIVGPGTKELIFLMANVFAGGENREHLSLGHWGCATKYMGSTVNKYLKCMLCFCGEDSIICFTCI